MKWLSLVGAIAKVLAVFIGLLAFLALSINPTTGPYMLMLALLWVSIIIVVSLDD